MQIESGEILSVQHYAKTNPFKSTLLKADDNYWMVKLGKELNYGMMEKGDPIVFGFERDKEIYMVGCDIVDIQNNDAIIKTKVDWKENQYNGSEKRQYERFPVSFYGDMKLEGERAKHFVTIKNMSYYGMLINSKDEFENGQAFDLSIYMEKQMLFLNGRIVRKIANEDRFSYGVTLVYQDINSLVFMKDYIHRIKENREKHIKQLQLNSLY